MARYNYPLIIWNSIVIAVISTVLATASSTMAGYALAKYRFMGNKLLFNTVMLSRMVPFYHIDSFILHYESFRIIEYLCRCDHPFDCQYNFSVYDATI